MDSRLNKGNKEILSFIALYRILTARQLATLTQKSRQSVRKRLRNLSAKGLIVTKMRGFGRSSGRPENIIFLSEKAAGILKDEELFSENLPLIPPKNIDAIAVDHDLLINWVYIHLIQMEKSIPDLTINPHTPGFIVNDQGNHGFFDSRIRIESDDEFIEFIPDGIFTIWHKGLEKGLLFFLEVDMDTEPIASPDRRSKDIRQKILNYQAIFRDGHYKHFEEIFHFNFIGFRLLFLTNSPARSASLSRLAEEMPPSDFVWLTNQEKMFSDGLCAEIWIRGGKINRPPQSIIGPKLAAKTPVLDSIE